MQDIPKGPLNQTDTTNDSYQTKDKVSELSEVRRKLDRIQVAKKYRDRVLEDLGVDRFIEEYNGVYNVTVSGVPVPPINEVYAFVQTSLANLFNKDPYITVNPQKTSSIKGAAILEVVCNYYKRLLRTKEEFELELMDCLLAGHAWHKTGIKVETIGTGVDTKIKSESFYSNRVPFKDIVFNIGSQRPPLDCRWIAQKIVLPTDEVKKKYGDRAIGVPGGPHPSLNEDELKTASYKSDLNFTTLWEYHDIFTRKVCVLAEGFDRYLSPEKDWPDYVNEFPFRMLWWNYNPKSAFPIPDIKPFEPQILEEIKFLGMALNHIKRNSRQLLAKKGTVSKTEMDKLEKGIDGSIIEVKTSGNPAEAVQPLAYAPMPVETFTILNRLQEIINKVGGQPSTDQGAPQRTISRTEDELIMIKEGSKTRTTRKLNRFEDHIESTFKDLIGYMQANFDMEQVVRITGETPQEIVQALGQNFDPITKTIKFSKEDIQGQFDVDVQAGSTLPLDKETRMSLLSLIFDKATRLAALPSIPPFMQVLIKEMLKDYGIKSLEEAFDLQTQQSEAAKAQQAHSMQMENDKLKAETDKRNAQAKDLEANTVLTTGRALHEAHIAGVLPEAIELGRGMGLFPSEDEGQRNPAVYPPEENRENWAPPPGME